MEIATGGSWTLRISVEIRSNGNGRNIINPGNLVSNGSNCARNKIKHWTVHLSIRIRFLWNFFRIYRSLTVRWASHLSVVDNGRIHRDSLYGKTLLDAAIRMTIVTSTKLLWVLSRDLCLNTAQLYHKICVSQVGRLKRFLWILRDKNARRSKTLWRVFTDSLGVFSKFLT